MKQVTIAEGKQGNLQTAKAMSQIAHQFKGHPEVRALALSVLNSYGVKSHDYLSEAVALAKYVQQNVRYVRDTLGIEQLHSPVLMINDIKRGIAQGDCDDMSLLLATLLLSVGVQPYFRMVRYKSNFGPFNHIYVVVKEKNKNTGRSRVVMDCIVKDKGIGYEVPHKSGEEVPV